MQEQTFIGLENWRESSTMYDNNYVDPQSGCTMLPADQVMGMEDNLQRGSIRLPNFSLGEDTHNNFSDEVGIGSDLQQQLNFELEQEYHNQMIMDVLQQQQDVCLGQQSSASVATAASSWEASFHEMQELTLFHQQQQQQNLLDQPHHIASYSAANNTTNCTDPTTTAYTPPPELLNLLHIPRCSVGSSTISFGSKKPTLDIFPILSGEMVDQNSRLYDPQLSFTPPSPCLRDILHTLPYQLNPPKAYLGLDENEAAFQEAEAGRQFTNSILDLKRDMSLSKGPEGRGTNHFATERQRREYLNEKYQNLRTLVPNPTKADRASIVGDAIDYIKELLRTVEEMKALVEEKRCGSGRSKRHRTNNNHEMESCSQAQAAAQPDLQCDQDQTFLTNGSLRSSWLQRSSKEGTHVDVRIVDNEVNIKLIQRKRRSCLLCVSLILHELQLEILHANGANIGEHYIFMFNTKIFEGSCEYARSIATKLMDAVDRQMNCISNF